MKILFAGSITVHFGSEKKLARLVKEGSRFAYISPFSGKKVMIGNIKKLAKFNTNGHREDKSQLKKAVKTSLPSTTRNSFRLLLHRNQSMKCHYCDRETPLEQWTIEHKTPISRGGSKQDPRNAVGSCWTCNHAKGRMTYEEFLETDYLPQDRRAALGFSDDPMPFSEAKAIAQSCHSDMHVHFTASELVSRFNRVETLKSELERRRSQKAIQDDYQI